MYNTYLATSLQISTVGSTTTETGNVSANPVDPLTAGRVEIHNSVNKLLHRINRQGEVFQTLDIKLLNLCSSTGDDLD